MFLLGGGIEIGGKGHSFLDKGRRLPAVIPCTGSTGVLESFDNR
jgi:hypothetical protein